MDGPTLITQPTGYPEERPETDDTDGMLEHLAGELEGKQLLEKPRVSKKVMVFALKEQNRIIGQLRREANANFLLLDDRSRRTQDLVQKLLGKINSQETQLQKAEGTITTMQGEMENMRGKIEEALKLIDIAKKLEEKIVSVQHRVETHTATLKAHETRFGEIDRLAGRVSIVEDALTKISGDNVFVTTDHMGEPMPLNMVVQNLQVTLTEYNVKIHEQSKALRQQSEVIAKAEGQLAEGVRVKLAKNDDIDLAEIRRGQTSIAEQLDVIQQELLAKIDKSYVDEHVEARYEEIINHLHKALSSTEQDEQDFKKRANNLQNIIEQLSANKADRRELLELKQFMVSLNGQERRSSMERRRSSSGSIGGGDTGDGNPLTGPITRDEVFNLLEEKADRKDLEKRMAAIVTRVNNAVIRRGSGGAPTTQGATPTGPAGPNGYGGTPAKRGGNGVAGAVQSNNDIDAWEAWEPDPDGALAMSKQLTDGFGRAVRPDGMAVGTCLSCKDGNLYLAQTNGPMVAADARVSGGSWRSTVGQDTLFAGMVGGLPRLRTLTFAIANWTANQARGGLQDPPPKTPLLAWIQQRAAVGNLSNPRRQKFPAFSSVGRRRDISTGRGCWAKAAAGRGDAGGEGVTFGTSEDAARRNADSSAVAFVTGANRGIGLEVTRQLLARSRGMVVAACRDPSSAADLHALRTAAGNEHRLDVVRMDIEDQVSLEAAAEHVKSAYGRVDLLFNVAGVLGDGKNTPGPERSLRAMDRGWLRHTLEVNTIGPMMLVAALTPLLESPAKKGDQAARPPSVVVNFSARVGSIGDNGMGGWHSYRMSKSALNMATKGISLELRRRRVWAFSYHPGTTDTGLSEPFQANVKPEKLFTPDYTVSQCLAIVDSMTEELSGGFFAFDGSRIVW
eukprot:g7368.t1